MCTIMLISIVCQHTLIINVYAPKVVIYSYSKLTLDTMRIYICVHKREDYT